MCSHVQTLSFFIVKNELLGDKMLIFDHYSLLNIVPKFVIHLKMSQNILRNYKFKIKRLLKCAAPTTVQWWREPQYLNFALVDFWGILL